MTVPSPARNVAFFCMPERGHFQRLRALISGVARAGWAAHVFTHADFRAAVERAGGVFHDLFAAFPLAEADDSSFPIPCRYVTFAAHYAEPICAAAARLGISLVVHDSFAVIGRLVADRLRVPRVNVISGHRVRPSVLLPFLASDATTHVAPACLDAVDVLRSRYGMADASPFWYVASTSQDLNICCEPPEFLAGDLSIASQPLEFFGSLPDVSGVADAFSEDERSAAQPGARRAPRVYVSFGTVVWRRYAAIASRAIAAIARAARLRPDTTFTVSLGGAKLQDTSAADLAAHNVRILDYVDQWATLQRADVFITHQGLNSTHEAVFHRVPMLSYPFFWDQPAMAATCARLGIARPLTEGARTELDAMGIVAALDDVQSRRQEMLAALEQARGWELDVMARRPAVVARVLSLGG